MSFLEGFPLFLGSFLQRFHCTQLPHSHCITCSLQTASEHEVYIVATDRGDPVRSTSVLVTITVGDINEFTPEFQYSREDFPDGVYTVETLSTARAGESERKQTFIHTGSYYLCTVLFAGTILLMVLATDDDGRDNDISYNITYDTSEEGSGSASGQQPTEEPEIFTFTINSEGEISNDDIFPDITEDEEVTSELLFKDTPEIRTPL